MMKKWLIGGGIKTLILGLLTVWMFVGCANAGKDRSVEAGQSVTLDAGLSSSTAVTVTEVALQAPVAQIHVSTTSTTVGTTLYFDANASSDADGQIVSYQWLDETNTTLSNQMTLSHTFTTSGEHTITLVVMDNDAQEGRASVNIVVEALLVSVDLSANTLNLDVNGTTFLLATAHYNDKGLGVR